METKIITVSLKSKEIQEATAPRSRKSHRREVVHLRMVACLVAAVAAVSTIALAASGTATEGSPRCEWMRPLLRNSLLSSQSVRFISRKRRCESSLRLRLKCFRLRLLSRLRSLSGRLLKSLPTAPAPNAVASGPASVLMTSSIRPAELKL